MEQYYLYRFSDAARTYDYCGVGHELVYQDAPFAPVNISHSAPTFSSDPSQARVTVRLKDDLQVAMNYISHPPPYKTELMIWEVTQTTGIGGSNSLLVEGAEEYWKGQITRIAWRESFTVAEILCKTLQEVHFSRETLNESLHPLCRFHLGDGRCPVNIENFKETVTVTNVSSDINEPTVTVSGITSPFTYRGGMIRTADQDWRTIEEQAGGLLTLSRAFPSTSIQNGDVVEIFLGDDLTQETCATVFGSETENGIAHGGWKLTPNRDYERFGIRSDQ